MSRNFDKAHDFLSQAEQIADEMIEQSHQQHIQEIQRQAWQELSDDVAEGWITSADAEEMYLKYFHQPYHTEE